MYYLTVIFCIAGWIWFAVMAACFAALEVRKRSRDEAADRHVASTDHPAKQ